MANQAVEPKALAWFGRAETGIPLAVRNGQLPRQRGRPDDIGDSPTAGDPPAAESPPAANASPAAEVGGVRRPSPFSFPSARSALGLRRVLAAFGLVTCGAAAGWLAAVNWPLPAALLALLALVAVVDLVVIQRRIRGERR